VVVSGRGLGAFLIAVAVLAAACSSDKGRAVSPAPRSTPTTTAITPATGVARGCVAFSRGGPDGGIHVLAADGTSRRITTDPGDDQAAWSPDGTKIVFNRYRKGDQQIYVMSATGSGQKRLTTGRSDASPTWSADGTRILFTREVPGRSDFYTMKADGSDVRRLTKGRPDDGTPMWSPDGSTIAFVGSGSRNLALYVMRAGGSTRRSIGGDINAAWPRWSPNGTELAFVDEDDGSIQVLNADGTGRRKVFDVTTLPGDMQPNFTEAAWSPDGMALIFAAGDSQSSHLYIVGIDGSGIKQVTTGPVTDEGPAWTARPTCR